MQQMSNKQFSGQYSTHVTILILSIDANTLLLIYISCCSFLFIAGEAGSGQIYSKDKSKLKTTTSTTSDPIEGIRHLLPEADLVNNSLSEVTVQLGDTAYLPCTYAQGTDEKILNDQVSLHTV